MRERVGDGTELQHIDPHSYGHNSVSFLFYAAQPRAWGPASLGAGFLYRNFSPTDWTSCAPSYVIVWPLPSCGRQKSHSFDPSMVKVIFWYSSTGCTCYLHRCISYFDSPAGSEVNIQHFEICVPARIPFIGEKHMKASTLIMLIYNRIIQTKVFDS